MASVACRDAKRQFQQLTMKERNKIDDVMRKGTATDALRAVNAQRVRKNIREVEKSTVYRFAKGLTHQRGATETRGRKRSLSKQNVRKLDTTLRRLIQAADNEKRITHADVVEAACLTDVACQRVCEDALRAEWGLIQNAATQDPDIRGRREASIWPRKGMGEASPHFLVQEGPCVRRQQELSDPSYAPAKEAVPPDDDYRPLAESF